MSEDPNVRQAAGPDGSAGTAGYWRSLALSVAVALALAAALALGGRPLLRSAAAGGARGCGAASPCCQAGASGGRVR